MNSLHPFWLIAAATAAGLVPVLLGLFTCYAKVSVVLGLVRNALGVQQIPNGMVVMALSLGVTVYTMSDVFSECASRFEQAHVSSFDRLPTAGEVERLKNSFEPWLAFLKRHAGARELKMLGGDVDENSLRILLPAFVLTELKSSFAMGFMLLLPFLVVDLIVANVLAGMGMQMVSPTVVSLPLKLILFVMCDGWLLVVAGLIQSYRV